MCENPRRLLLPSAIGGEHKLWKMPKERLKSMQSGLVPVDTDWIDLVNDESSNLNENEIQSEHNNNQNNPKKQQSQNDSSNNQRQQSQKLFDPNLDIDMTYDEETLVLID